MNKIVKLEYDEEKYVEIELREDNDCDGGLGGLDTVIGVGQKVFDRSIGTLVSFLDATAKKIERKFDSAAISEVSITVGAAFSAEGNLIVASSTSEVNFAITVTFKGED